MRRILCRVVLCFAVCPLFCQGMAYAVQNYGPGRFGAGIVLGAPTGLSAKYWLDKTHAVDAALGFGDISIHADFLWHDTGLLGRPRSGRLSAYGGLGAEFKDYGHNSVLGIRAVGGAAYDFPSDPFEIFLELVPILRPSLNSGLYLNAGLGVRYYFQPARSGRYF